MRCFSQGLIDPIRPIKSFPASQVVDAFRYMQKGQHIGKIVVTMPGEGHASSASNLEIVRRAKSVHFRQMHPISWWAAWEVLAGLSLRG